MKILHFITSIDVTGGGPSRSVPLMAKGQSLLGHDVTLMTFRSPQMNVELLHGANVRLHILPENYNKVEIENFLSEENFDIIQLQSIWDLRYHCIAKYARKLNIPYIITPRGMLEPWSLQQKWLKKKAALFFYQGRDLNRAACIYTTALSEATHVKDLHVSTPCSVIPNGIDTSSYPCRDSQNLSIKKQVLFLSRIHVKKGIELLIKAWESIHCKYPEWSLTIVGNGDEDYIRQLKLQISHVELSDVVHIIPPVFGKDKIKLYQESSFFVLPSYSENFGMVVAEAMSCGLPVLTTTSTPWEMLNETNTGWCISLSVDNLIQTLNEAMSMPSDILMEMGQRASKLIRHRFDFKEVAVQTIDLYRWILGGHDKPDFIV